MTAALRLAQHPPLDSSQAPDTADFAAGRGEVELARAGGRTRVVRMRADSPLRLLNPGGHASGAWVVAGSYGGGLVDGDRLDLAVRCGEGTTTIIGTQASTKVYRTGGNGRGADRGVGCRQSMRASIGHDALLVSWPDPVTCFAGSQYHQHQSFELTPTASLVAVDWLTSGRMARGERWAFARYQSATSVRIDGRLRWRESLTLDPADGPLDALARTAGMDCLGIAWVMGPAFADVAETILRRLEREPIDPRRPVLFGVSRLDDGDGAAMTGTVLRFAARSTDAAWLWLRGQLSGALSVVGMDPWSRRG